LITESQVQEYFNNGAILIKDAFDLEWLSILGEGMEKNRKDPGPYACQYTPKDDLGDFYDDYCNWDRFDEYKSFVFNSPAAEIAGRLTRSHQVRIFHEHILVKEPNTSELTPWHQDQPYYCVDGEQVCTIWLPLDPVPKEYGLEFVSGSHTWGKMFTPKKFLTHDEYDYQSSSFKPIPDIETNRDKYKILSWDLEPGDCIAFHFKTLHGGAGNPRRHTRRRAFSVRWIGDDVIYAERPGEISPPFPELKSFKQDDPLDHPLFPICWENK